MKPYYHFLLILVICPLLAHTQFGIKAGLNFAKVTKASNINGKNSTGFHAGVFLAPKTEGVIGYRSELIYSRQGYDFKSGTTTGSVDLDYLLLPQLMEINITKVFTVQVGGQMAFLLNAKADSTKTSTGNAQVDKLVDLMNRFDYGAAGGIEIHPYKGILFGARMNISFGNLFKDPASLASRPNFFPAVDAKNNVVQLFVGYKF
ncbi:MAG: PorT family protein [Chitinophagaceae bacterium]|nr:PorT family protein [Chitinophagaceae bacterium]